MKIQTGVPETITHECDVHLDGAVVDSFVIRWKTPTDDQQTDSLQMSVDLLQMHKSGDNELMAQQFPALRERTKAYIQRSFVTIEREDYEDGDLLEMFKHNHYLFALSRSLGSAKAAYISKNGVTLEQSGQQDDTPLLTAASQD